MINIIDSNKYKIELKYSHLIISDHIQSQLIQF